MKWLCFAYAKAKIYFFGLTSIRFLVCFAILKLTKPGYPMGPQTFASGFGLCPHRAWRGALPLRSPLCEAWAVGKES